jgi:hypothetical protein
VCVLLQELRRRAHHDAQPGAHRPKRLRLRWREGQEHAQHAANAPLWAAAHVSPDNFAPAATVQEHGPSQHARTRAHTHARTHIPTPPPSGYRSGLLSVWDLRTGSTLAFLNDPALGGETPTAHAQMVTSLDACEHLLFSGGTDKAVKVWDLRWAGDGGVAGQWGHGGDGGGREHQVHAHVGCHAVLHGVCDGVFGSVAIKNRCVLLGSSF